MLPPSEMLTVGEKEMQVYVKQFSLETDKCEHYDLVTNLPLDFLLFSIHFSTEKHREHLLFKTCRADSLFFFNCVILLSSKIQMMDKNMFGDKIPS